MKRKSPFEHNVIAHTRNGKRVGSYTRGSNKRSQRSSRVVGVEDNKDSFVFNNERVNIIWDPMKIESQERVFMSPEEYLKLTASPRRFNEGSIDFIDNQVRNKHEIYAPFLYVDEDSGVVLSHEGRHRSLWAYRNKVPKIPVAIFHKRLVNDRTYGRVHRFVPIDKNLYGRIVKESEYTSWDATKSPISSEGGESNE